MTSFSRLRFQSRSTTPPNCTFRPAFTFEGAYGTRRLTWTVTDRASPGIPRESNACAVTRYVPSRVNGAVPSVPRLHENAQFVAPEPLRSPPLTPSSTVQCTAFAAVVVSGLVKVSHVTAVPEVICAAGSGKLVMRGPRPPLGFTTSDVWVRAWLPVRSRQLSRSVRRRKSSGLASVGAPATAVAFGVQALGGSVAKRPSFGSSKVHTEASTV